MQKKKYLLVIPALAFLALLGAGSASAFGGFDKGGGMMGKNIDPNIMTQNWGSQMATQAGLLGISVDELKSKWAAGKTIKEIALEKGISEADWQAKMQASRLAEHKQILQTLVDKGQLTQAQADTRLKFMESNQGKQGRRAGRQSGNCQNFK